MIPQASLVFVLYSREKCANPSPSPAVDSHYEGNLYLVAGMNEARFVHSPECSIETDQFGFTKQVFRLFQSHDDTLMSESLSYPLITLMSARFNTHPQYGSFALNTAVLSSGAMSISVTSEYAAKNHSAKVTSDSAVIRPFASNLPLLQLA